MPSSYSRDPRVPPLHVEHLGKHHRPAVAPEPAAREQPVDAGPTYEDFLEREPGTDELPDKTG